MNIRKQRIHQVGHSNIDFRSKNDQESLKIFQPWKVMTAPGTMGYSGYKTNPEEIKKALEVSKKINTQNVLSSHIPDPKYHKTAEFYYKNKIPIKSKTMYTTDRVAQLEESFKGKEVFTGDSMMISDINKYRKNKTKKKYDDMEKIQKLRIHENIIRDKNQKNKGAIQETQLVNINAEVTADTKVDINKIKEVRYALRRRYANRTNFRKIFKEWDKNGMGEINLYDAHSMLNKLGIPINYNETLALIASSNNRGSESLSLDEFMHLIFSDNTAVDLDINRINFKEEKYHVEGEQIDKLKKKMRDCLVETSKTNELNYVKEYLRIRIPSLAKFFNEVANSDGLCNYDSLTNVIKRFPMPEKYKSAPMIDAIYSQYTAKDGHLMDYKKFIEDVISTGDENYFFNFKDHYLYKIKEKIDGNTQNMIDSINSFKLETEKKKILANELDKAIHKIHEKKEENIQSEKETNGTVPSTEFINKIFANKENYFQRHKELEKELSPHPSLLKEIQPKTRYGANPPYQNTFTIIQPPEYAGSYISEKDRFHNKKLDVDYLEHDKEKKNNYHLHRIEKLKSLYQKVSDDKAIKEHLAESKDTYSLLQRTKKLFKYELINKLRNDIVE